MKQYQCENVPQVAHKIAELTETLPDRETWKKYCEDLKRNKRTSDTVDYIDGNGNDVVVFFGYDGKSWYVGIEE